MMTVNEIYIGTPWGAEKYGVAQGPPCRGVGCWIIFAKICFDFYDVPRKQFFGLPPDQQLSENFTRNDLRIAIEKFRW